MIILLFGRGKMGGMGIFGMLVIIGKPRKGSFRASERADNVMTVNSVTNDKDGITVRTGITGRLFKLCDRPKDTTRIKLTIGPS